MFAKVVVDVKSSNVDVMYTYHIPNEFDELIFIGSRVLVEFGLRTIMGYVLEISETTDYEGQIKDILDVLDYSKELSLEQIELAKDISKNNHCLLIKALELMQPAFLKTKYRKFIAIKNFNKLDANIALLFAGKNKILLTKEMLKDYPKIKYEIKNGNLVLEHDIFYYGKRKYVKYYSLNPISKNVYSSLKGMKIKIVNYLDNISEAIIDDIKDSVGCSSYIVNKLVQEGILKVTERPYVKEEDIIERKLLKKVNFNVSQNEIKEKYDALNSKPFLLYSNDEDFKMDLYLEIIKDNILNNKKVFIMTPSLVYNYTVYNFLKHNLEGYSIINFSSDLTNSEFYNNYMSVKMDFVDVVVTTKVGAFLPLENVGAFIIVDEDNQNYLNEMHPKYSILEVLKFRAKFQNSKILLSSSTPSIESYYNYFQAKYYLLKYKIDYNKSISTVNMRDEVFENNNIISSELYEKLRISLHQGKQSMLILNAKGYSSNVVCRKCGKVLKCPKCHITVTYYKENNECKCRYCGSKTSEMRCACGNNDFSIFGMGLEMVKEKINELFPQARVLLLDGDSLKDNEDYQNVVIKIESGEVDIIIGTNNILSLSKFSNIDLIGLLAVDNLLNVSDYRASYNTFSLISKAMNTTNVVIQGYDLNHYCISNAVNNDYVNFYNEEIKVRNDYYYPPFVEINKVLIAGDFKEMYHAANYFKKVVHSVMDAKCLGPNYDKIRRGVYIIIKHNDFDRLIKILKEVEKKFSNSKLEFTFERFPRFL